MENPASYYYQRFCLSLQAFLPRNKKKLIFAETN